MAVDLAVPFILYLVRFCSSKSCKTGKGLACGWDTVGPGGMGQLMARVHVQYDIPRTS